MVHDLERIKAILAEALEKSGAAERNAYLQEACGTDEELRSEVESLLKAHSNAGKFLEAPPIDLDITLDTSPISEGPGTVIGRYKLLEQIGEGGFGVVYMAEQTEPISRRVALKIIKLGMDTKQVIARFEAERQALAMMDHPNIAKVFDAGATDTGRPYFVMELVKGIPITDYCDRNNLDTQERLKLFVEVCKAVQHAHQKGIIHRDLKPSNVLISLHDGRPVPKVIDFGIAKAVCQKLTEKTLFTRFSQMIGTPEYMSPEQADFSGLDVDTRTDIYSLGVLLYQLLTGVTPLDSEKIRQAGYNEMQRIIREQEPDRPSTRLSGIGEAITDVAKRRKASPDALQKLLRGDLDWIAMKSLEKDRTRRYDTANELAMDIQRHLNDEPIIARAPGTVYLLRKFLRRRRRQVISVSIAASLLILTAIVLSLWYRDRIRFAREETAKHRDILDEAKSLFQDGDLLGATQVVEVVLDSKYLGSEAKSLHNRILEDVAGRIRLCTERIDGNPDLADNYLMRAQYLHCLHDKDATIADMGRYLTCLYPAEGPDADRHPFRDLLMGLWANSPENLASVNSLADDSGPCISEDRLMLIFCSKRARGASERNIWMAERASVSEPWGTPEYLGPPVDSTSFDYHPAVSGDGLFLYFSSTRPGGLGKQDIWVASRKNKRSSWADPKRIENVNSPYTDWGPTVSADNLELFFSSDRPGGYGLNDMYVSERAGVDEPWGEPKNLGPPVNTDGQDANANLSADGLTLFFAPMPRAGGSGQADIWAARRTTRDDDWGPPLNLGPTVNSAGSEVSPCLSPDGTTLYFSSHRPGWRSALDLWKVSARHAPKSEDVE